MLADYTWDKLLILPQYTRLERNRQVGVICITNYSGQTFSAVRGRGEAAQLSEMRNFILGLRCTSGN